MIWHYITYNGWYAIKPNQPNPRKENDFTLKKKDKKKTTETITDADYRDDLTLLANTPAQSESLLDRPEQAASGIGLNVNSDKTEFMCFKQDGTISTLNDEPLKLVVHIPH